MKIKNAAQPRCRIQIQQNKETKWIINSRKKVLKVMNVFNIFIMIRVIQ